MPRVFHRLKYEDSGRGAEPLRVAHLTVFTMSLDDLTDEVPAEAAQEELPPTHIFALKTTINQEKSVGHMLGHKAGKQPQAGVRAVLAPPEIRGYVFVEAEDRDLLEVIIKGVPHARGLVVGETAISEVEHFLVPKPAVSGIAEGDIVELVSGPFKGERARVQRIDAGKEEITVELFEAMVPIPVTVRGDHVRVLQKKE